VIYRFLTLFLINFNSLSIMDSRAHISRLVVKDDTVDLVCGNALCVLPKPLI